MKYRLHCFFGFHFWCYDRDAKDESKTIRKWCVRCGVVRKV